MFDTTRKIKEFEQEDSMDEKLSPKESANKLNLTKKPRDSNFLNPTTIIDIFHENNSSKNPA